MKANYALEQFGRTVNDLDGHYPKGRSRCFDIGIWGGCGVRCAAFIDGECGEPQEMDFEEMKAEYDYDELLEVCSKYECFKEAIHGLSQN